MPKPFYDRPEDERVALTEKAIAERRTLMERWAELKAPEAEEWSPRSALAAKLLTGCRAVADLGCGTMPLRGYLPSGVRYIPIDALDRDADTIVADLNKDPVPGVDADAWAALGLLEYLFDVPGLLRQLSGTVVTSYNPIERTDAVRRGHAWVNDYDTAELEKVFVDCGFTIVARQELGSQWVWKLQR